MLCYAWCVQVRLLPSLVQALAERYSGHLGRPLDAMKEAESDISFAMHKKPQNGPEC